MPSGAKKRKAARKKKENENNKINPSATNTHNPTQGNDDLKSQDEKGSDGEHCDSFNGGSEKVEERDPSAVRPFASDVKLLEEVPSDVKIEPVLSGNEESYERKDESFDHVETAEEEHASGNEGGTSNGESLTEKNMKDGNFNSLGEAIECHKLVKSVDSSPSEMNLITKNLLVEAAESEVVVPSLEVTNLALKTNGDNAYPLNDENATTSNFEEPKPKEYGSKVLTSESASPITKLTNGAEHIKNSESPECFKNQPRVTSAPILVPKTAWWNCCGLIEVLSDSNR